MSEILRWLADMVRDVFRTLDWPLFLGLSALMGIGLAVLYSAGGEAQGTRLMLAQGARFGVGLLAMWGLSRVSPTRLRAWTPGVFLVSLLPLILVLFIGTGKHGQHWIDLKLFYLQPSELMKISLPMMMAWYLHREPLPPAIRTVLVAGALIALPTGLILLQPDFGTAMLVDAAGNRVGASSYTEMVEAIAAYPTEVADILQTLGYRPVDLLEELAATYGCDV